MNSYYVGVNDPFSDTLTALGLQRLLAELLEKQGSPTDGIRFIDCGVYIELALTVPIHPATVAALNETNYIMGGVKFIRTLKNVAGLPPDLPESRTEDYEARKLENAAFYAALKQKGRDEPLPYKPLIWDVLRTINPAALPGWTGVLSDWWRLRPQQATVVQLILDLYSELPNRIDDASARWKKLNKANGWDVDEMTTCLQVFNPDQGKGQNRAKADAVSVGNMKGFWLVEFLKMVGFTHDVISKTVAGGKDRKIFVIAPLNMPFGVHDAILQRFKAVVTTEPSIRFDVLAALRYTQTLLNYTQEANDGGFSLLGLNIQQQVVGGFRTAFYKDLGNAVATMNLSSIALPGWVQPNSADEVIAYQAAINDLITFTRQFDESHSDAYRLLQHLRDFVSGDDLNALFQLTNAFPAYYIGMRERGKYAAQLTTTTLERIIHMTDAKLSKILESPGFQNIAYAIRQSTVTAQYRKSQNDRKYDVRYGLGQQLTRVARKGKESEFIAELADFIHKYNAENAQVMEVRSGPYRRSIQTSDIDDIVRLVDAYDAPTIAQMLVAYGYARLPKDTVVDEAPDAVDIPVDEE
jgi:hypothetical protein